jgi:hypothetical protein
MSDDPRPLLLSALPRELEAIQEWAEQRAQSLAGWTPTTDLGAIARDNGLKRFKSETRERLARLFGDPGFVRYVEFCERRGLQPLEPGTAEDCWRFLETLRPGSESMTLEPAMDVIEDEAPAEPTAPGPAAVDGEPPSEVQVLSPEQAEAHARMAESRRDAIRFANEVRDRIPFDRQSLRMGEMRAVVFGIEEALGNLNSPDPAGRSKCPSRDWHIVSVNETFLNGSAGVDELERYMNVSLRIPNSRKHTVEAIDEVLMQLCQATGRSENDVRSLTVVEAVAMLRGQPGGDDADRSPPATVPARTEVRGRKQVHPAGACAGISQGVVIL